jgi:hypothetical protein
VPCHVLPTHLEPAEIFNPARRCVHAAARSCETQADCVKTPTWDRGFVRRLGWSQTGCIA